MTIFDAKYTVGAVFVSQTISCKRSRNLDRIAKIVKMLAIERDVVVGAPCVVTHTAADNVPRPSLPSGADQRNCARKASPSFCIQSRLSWRRAVLPKFITVIVIEVLTKCQYRLKLKFALRE